MKKNRKTILVVEDDVSLLNIISGVLEVDGFVVIKAKNGLEALEQLEHNPDLIWLDLYMPEMDGLEFLDMLQDIPQHRHIPIIVATVSRGKDEASKHYDKVNIVGHYIKSDEKITGMLEKVRGYFNEQKKK